MARGLVERSMVRRFLALSLIASALSACGGSAGAPDDSGIRGRALLGPTCPVVTEGMECRPEPYEAGIRVLAAGSSELVATVRSGKDGRFEVFLTPGDYVLAGVSTAESFPSKPVEVTVRPGTFARVTMAFDSGIR